MKRLIAAAMLVAALIGLFGSTVEMPGADMAVDVPAGWMVMTRSDAESETTAAMFGMTSEDAVKMMEDGDFYLILYEPKTGAEMYVTVFGSQYAKQLRSMNWLTPDEVEIAKEDLLEGYSGWAYDSDVMAKQLGDFTYLAMTMHTEVGENRLDNRQLFTVYDGLEIYVDLYAKESELLETHAAAQDVLAASLQVEYAQVKAQRAYRWVVFAAVGLLMMMLTQFVGIALTVMLRVREKMV